MIEEQVFQRRFAEVVRVEIRTALRRSFATLLLDELRRIRPKICRLLPDVELVESGPLLELGDLMSLATLEIPELRDPPFVPARPQGASRYRRARSST